jgi:hypothetical protein
MKIKTDFVTNSSSSSYVLALDESEIPDLIKFMDQLKHDQNNYGNGTGIKFVFSKMKSLLDYVNGRPYDWASKPYGFQFANMGEERFTVCKDVIENKNKVAVGVRVDYMLQDKFHEGGWEKYVAGHFD